MARRAPVFLDLRRIHLPPPGQVSILHRVSGVLLALAVPGSLWLLQLSLTADGMARIAAGLHSPPGVLLAALLAWSLAHHLLAGLRFLLLDLDIGIARDAARRSARWVLAGAPLLALALLARLYL